jgi:hypothetical protein
VLILEGCLLSIRVNRLSGGYDGRKPAAASINTAWSVRRAIPPLLGTLESAHGIDFVRRKAVLHGLPALGGDVLVR